MFTIIFFPVNRPVKRRKSLPQYHGKAKNPRKNQQRQQNMSAQAHPTAQSAIPSYRSPANAAASASNPQTVTFDYVLSTSSTSALASVPSSIPRSFLASFNGSTVQDKSKGREFVFITIYLSRTQLTSIFQIIKVSIKVRLATSGNTCILCEKPRSNKFAFLSFYS